MYYYKTKLYQIAQELLIIAHIVTAYSDIYDKHSLNLSEQYGEEIFPKRREFFVG